MASAAFITAIADCEDAQEAATAFADQAPALVGDIQTLITQYDKDVAKWNEWIYKVIANSEQKEFVADIWPNTKLFTLGDMSYGGGTGYCDSISGATDSQWTTTDSTEAQSLVSDVQMSNDSLGEFLALTKVISATEDPEWGGGGNVLESIVLNSEDPDAWGESTANDYGSMTSTGANIISYLEELVEKQETLSKLMEAYDEAVDECQEEAMEEGGNFVGQACEDMAIPDSWCELLPDDAYQTDAEAAAGKAKANAMGAEGLGGSLSAINFAGARNFKEQCFLLAKIFELATYKKEVIEIATPKKLPYYANVPPSSSISNACIMAEGQPYGFINRLTQSPSQAEFFDIQTDVLSSLQPMIRLYKVNLDEDPETGEILESEQEYVFDSSTTYNEVQSLFLEKGKRGFGAGIKDFSFVYDGNNPFAAKKSIKAKLTIFANSFDELMKDRGEYSYIELALKTGSGKAATETSTASEEEAKEQKKNQDKLNFRLKAVVGWASPGGQLPYNAGSVIDAVNDSFITINLTPTIHEFNIDQQGRVNFVINYLAYVDDAFDQPKYNIFSNIDISLETYKRTLRYKTLQTKCSASQVSEIKKQELESDTVNEEKRKSLMSLMGKLLSTDKMRFINISFDDLMSFQTLGPYAELAGGASVGSLIQPAGGSGGQIAQELYALYNKEVEAAAAEGEEDELKLSLMANDPTVNNVPFFYVSDLIDVILEGIDINLEELPQKLLNDPDVATYINSDEIDLDDLTEEITDLKKYSLNFKKLRILLGPLELVNPVQKDQSKFVNFGDIPISAKYFTEWMTEKLIKKEQVVYPLSRFLSDFFNNLIRNFLNDDDCFGSIAKQRTVLNQAVLTSYKNLDSDGNPKEYDEIIEYMLRGGGVYTITDPTKWLSRAILDPATGGAPQPILNIAGSKGTPTSNPGQDREVNYLTFFAGRTQPAELMLGEKEADEERGIFHYMLGKDRGIVKRIELSKTDAKYLKEVRFEQEGYDGLEQLREVYDINITTYANVGAFPGTYIYVDPQGFAPNSKVDDQIFDLTQFGIGGYCMIIRNETSFAAGTAETKLTAKWVASKNAEIGANVATKDAETDSEGSDSNNSLCYVGNREEESLMTGWMEGLMDWAGMGADDLGTAEAGTEMPS